MINDKDCREHLLHVIYEAFAMMIRRREVFALTLLVQSLLGNKNTPKELLKWADDSLLQALCVLPASQQLNYLMRQSVLGLLLQIAKTRKNESKVNLTRRAIGEAMVMEAERYSDVSNGATMAMVLFESAAQHFEKLGDRDRAGEQDS